eukprot:UN30858
MYSICIFVPQEPGHEHHYVIDGPILEFDNLGITAGIFLFCLAGHGCLPAVYDKMEHPDMFGVMLNWVFIIMCVPYLVVAYVVYILYGYDSDILMTQNFA